MHLLSISRSADGAHGNFLLLRALPHVAAVESSGLVLTLLTQLYDSCEARASGGTVKHQRHLLLGYLWRIGEWKHVYQVMF